MTPPLPPPIWARLMFYEQIPDRPPLHLRLLLPVPLGAEGRRTRVGDMTRCRYENGYLLKQVTAIDAGHRYEFVVNEQQLRIGGGIRLLGGCYHLHAIRGGGTEVLLTTEYLSPKRPRWLWGPIEAAVCHAFHRHILRAMRRRTESASPIVEAWDGNCPGARGITARLGRSSP